jgi:hypothetical protein
MLAKVVVTSFDWVSMLPSLSVTVSVTVRLPAEAKVWLTVVPEPVFPSPKSQA